MKPPGDLMVDLPWYDGRVIYKSGDEAVPMAIAVTEADAAAIVTALAAVEPQIACLRVRDKPGPSGSMFCEAPAAAIMLAPSGGGGPRCIEHIAEVTGAQIAPLDYHPDTWSAVRRLLASWCLPAGGTRDAWVDQSVGNLRAMRVGFVSRFRTDDMPPLPVSREDARIMRQEAPARMEAARGRTYGDGGHVEHFVRVPGGDWALASDVLDAEGHPSETLAHLFAAAGDLATTADALYDRLDSANYVTSVAKDTAEELRRQRDEARARAEAARGRFDAAEERAARLRIELNEMRTALSTLGSAAREYLTAEEASDADPHASSAWTEAGIRRAAALEVLEGLLVEEVVVVAAEAPGQ